VKRADWYGPVVDVRCGWVLDGLCEVEVCVEGNVTYAEVGRGEEGLGYVICEVEYIVQEDVKGGISECVTDTFRNGI